MYICICNALRDRELATAADGAKHVADVFKRCGKRPQCGKCLPDVARIIDDVQVEDSCEILAAE